MQVYRQPKLKFTMRMVSTKPLQPMVLERLSKHQNLLQASESTIYFRDFCAILWYIRMWFGSNMWAVCNGVIDQHGDADVNDNGILQIQLFCNNALFIKNTFFQHSDMQTWVRDLCVSGHSLISAQFELTASKQRWAFVSNGLQNCRLITT